MNTNAPNVTPSPAGGPNTGSFLQAFQSIVTALYAVAKAFSGVVSGDLSGTISGPITVTGIEGVSAAPAAWTPSDGSGAGLVFTAVSAQATRLGNIVMASAELTYPVTADGSSAIITGLPVIAANHGYARVGAPVVSSGGTLPGTIVPIANTNSARIIRADTGAAITNANLSAQTLGLLLIYPSS